MSITGTPTDDTMWRMEIVEMMGDNKFHSIFLYATVLVDLTNFLHNNMTYKFPIMDIHITRFNKI